MINLLNEFLALIPEVMPGLAIPGIESSVFASWVLAFLLFVFFVGLFRKTL